MKMFKRKKHLQSVKFIYGTIQDDRGEVVNAIVCKAFLSKSFSIKDGTAPLCIFTDGGEPSPEYIEAFMIVADFIDDTSIELAGLSSDERVKILTLGIRTMIEGLIATKTQEVTPS